VRLDTADFACCRLVPRPRGRFHVQGRGINHLAAGPRDCNVAIALVGAIRERVIADLRTAAELAKERE
jgi:hypothetical protein